MWVVGDNVRCVASYGAGENHIIIGVCLDHRDNVRRRERDQDAALIEGFQEVFAAGRIYAACRKLFNVLSAQAIAVQQVELGVLPLAQQLNIGTGRIGALECGDDRIRIEHRERARRLSRQ